MNSIENLMENDLDAKFTVVIGTARGAYELEEDAKKTAMDLAYLNTPRECWIEDVNGDTVFAFTYRDGVMTMDVINRQTLVVDYDS